MYTNFAVDFGEQIESTETYETDGDIYLEIRLATDRSGWLVILSVAQLPIPTIYRLEIGVYGNCYTQMKKLMRSSFFGGNDSLIIK